MWTTRPLEEYQKRYRKWPKKYHRELKAAHDNLDTFLKALQKGQRPAEAKFGFIHPEPGGVLAIDQKGGGQGMMETRLYVYPDEAKQCLTIITLGDKQTQHDDIAYCKSFVKATQEETTPPHHLTHEKAHAQE